MATTMPRHILPPERLHPAISERVSNLNRDIVEKVSAAIAQHPVVVVGMSMNPFPKRACAALRQAGIAFEYLEYGSYLNMWRERNALKMWTGWPTFPMVFVKGTLVGGASDLKRLLDSGELGRMLA